jgi:hypothetical protein
MLTTVASSVLPTSQPAARDHRAEREQGEAATARRSSASPIGRLEIGGTATPGPVPRG